MGSNAQGGDEWRVLLAMSRLPGMSLVGFLRSYRADVFDQAAPEEATWDSVLARCGEACFYAHELLIQLSGVMEHIGEQIFHRDVHSRNILVEDVQKDGVAMPCFGLVDFGLAVEAPAWRKGLWR